MKLNKAQEKYICREEYKHLSQHVFFFKGAKEIVVFTRDTKDVKSLEKSNLKIWIDQSFPKLFTFPKAMSSDEIVKEKKQIMEIMIVDMQIKNQYSTLIFSRDPWATVPRLERDDHKLHYFAPYFYLKEVKNRFSITEDQENKIVNDYKEHFPYFDDFIKWLIANRFTTNRRTSYTYLRVSAGFGKSFLASLFEGTGTGRKILANQLKSNSASDLSPADFRNAFILMIDEFTHFSQELKDMTHGMYLSAKYQLSEYVPLYAKVFLSAEKSTSFFGEAGVDAQLADRVSVMDLSESGALENRKIYRDNTLFYKEALQLYVYKKFKEEADKYIEIGELKANEIANDILDLHKSKFGIEADTIEKIREKCYDYLKDYQEWSNEFVDNFGNRSRNSFFEKLEKNVFVKNDDEIVVKDIVKMYEVLIGEAGEQFQKTARFKQTMLDEVFLTSLDKKGIKCKGKTVRGVLINLAKLFKTKGFILEVEDKDGNITESREVEHDGETPY